MGCQSAVYWVWCSIADLTRLILFSKQSNKHTNLCQMWSIDLFINPVKSSYQNYQLFQLIWKQVKPIKPTLFLLQGSFDTISRLNWTSFIKRVKPTLFIYRFRLSQLCQTNSLEIRSWFDWFGSFESHSPMESIVLNELSMAKELVWLIWQPQFNWIDRVNYVKRTL